MNAAQTPSPTSGHQGSGLQFSIRSLLVLTACCSVAIWLWPMERNDPIEFQILLAFLVASLMSTLFLMPAAWRRMAERKRSGIAPREHSFEYFAFVCGIVGMAPYTCASIMFFLDPVEHRGLGVHEIMELLLFTGTYLWIPVQLLLIGSVALFFGIRRNLPVLLMRGIGIVGNLGFALGCVLAVRNI